MQKKRDLRGRRSSAKEQKQLPRKKLRKLQQKARANPTQQSRKRRKLMPK